MSDVFYEMSKVTIKPVLNYIVLQIFLISSLNFTLVVAFCSWPGYVALIPIDSIMDRLIVLVVVLRNCKKDVINNEIA